MVGWVVVVDVKGEKEQSGHGPIPSNFDALVICPRHVDAPTKTRCYALANSQAQSKWTMKKTCL